MVVLKSDQDGLSQIAAALRGRTGIAGLHLVSHGEPGSLKLGTLTLDSGALALRGGDVETIRTSLLRDADIFLYGCNVAQGEAGQRFINALSRATCARVAASTNLMGATDRGGDWILESRSGSMPSSALAFPAFRHVLPTVAATMRFNTRTRSNCWYATRTRPTW